jgi:hypothetical protein
VRPSVHQARIEHGSKIYSSRQRLLAIRLATLFKDYADNNSGTSLSAEMLKKIRAMGDLSYDLRKSMYSRKVPRTKRSGESFVPVTHVAVPEALNQPDSKLRLAAELCLQLAARLKDVTNLYMEKVNQNTVSLAPGQMNAREIVNTAARLEGLAYDLIHN